jgi:hypothetical protein
MRSLWDTFRNSGFDWSALINRAKYPGRRDSLNKSDVETFRKFAEENQRKSKPAHRRMIRAWRAGEIQTATPIDPRTGLPKGWTYRNLMRRQSSKFELTAMRQGLGAAIADHFGKVLSTRCGLYVGSHYVPDDVLRDMQVLLLQGAAGKLARVSELGVLDLYSAHRFAVHRRPEFIDDSGKKDKLKEREMRFLVAAVLRNQGYSPRGTEWVVELGTAAIRKLLAAFLHDHSDGLITVREAGIIGKKQALAELTGRGGGNSRHKAPVESHHNLAHNEAGHLLAQVGHDRNPPEWLHGMERDTQQVIKWINTLPPERAGLLRSRHLEYWQCLSLLRDIDQIIAERTDHDLQGWADCGHTTIEYRVDLTSDDWMTQHEFLTLPDRAQQTVLALCDVMPPGTIVRPRKLSPLEAYYRGSEELIKFPDHVIALMFCDKTLGDDLRVSRRLNAESQFDVQDSLVEPEAMQFRGIVATPAGETLPLDGRASYGVVVNPFDTSALWVYDGGGRYIGTAPRIVRARLADRESIIPQLAHRSSEIARLTAPLQERHADMAANIREIQAHNAAVVSGHQDDAEASRVNKSATRLGKALQANTPAPQPEPADTGIIEDWGDSPTPNQHQTDNVETW